MEQLEVKTDERVLERVNSYPQEARKRFDEIRALIIEVATRDDRIKKMEETVKWGEPSYITPIGSTLRMDWKSTRPDEFAIFFKCTSLLVPTFKVAFPKEFNYEGNRAIWLHKDEDIPVGKLRSCILATLTYHKAKKLPNLGIF